MHRRHTDEAGKITALSALAENYGKAFSDALLDMWLNLLAQYSSQHVFAAVRLVIERYEYKSLPPFAVLKIALDELSGTGGKSLELQAIAEWGNLLAAISQHGFYNKPVLHKTTEQVVRLLGGWEIVCQWQTSSYDFKRRDFISLWLESHGKADQLQLGAAGIIQALKAARPELEEHNRV